MKTTLQPGAGDRWLGAAAPIDRISRTMALIAGASLLGHLAVVGTIAVSGRVEVVPPTEIAVEIVHEMPKVETAKAEPVKTEVAKGEPIKPEVAKPEVAKPEVAEPEVAKPEVAKAEPVKPEPVKPAPGVTKAAQKSDEAADARKLAALERELASLRAEQAQLEAERATPEPPVAAMPIALHDSGLGLLPGSFQAAALPNTTDGAGEAVSYQEIVFSALAKAKGFGRRQGVPGSTSVRFSLDSAGKLVAVELVRWSGVAALDTEALDIVRRAAFPPPPQGAQRTFVANVNFEVERAR